MKIHTLGSEGKDQEALSLPSSSCVTIVDLLNRSHLQVLQVVVLLTEVGCYRLIHPSCPDVLSGIHSPGHEGPVQFCLYIVVCTSQANMLICIGLPRPDPFRFVIVNASEVT